MKTSVQFLQQTFGDSRVPTAQATVQQDLSGRSLPPDTAAVSLSTEEREDPFPYVMFLTAQAQPFYTSEGYRFDTDNESGSSETTPTIGAWTQADGLSILRGGSVLRTLYPQELRRASSDHAAVTLTSALGLLTQFGHRGGIYAGTVAQGNITAGNLIRQICGYVNGQPAAGVRVTVAETFEDVLLYGWLPYVTPSGVAGSQRGSAKDNLLQVVFALNACVIDMPDGSLRVDNLSTSVVSTLGKDKVYREGASVQELPPVTSVTVVEHSFAPGTESKVLFEGATAAGQVIIFSEPCSSLSASGFTITSSGANFAVVSSGTGTLTGVPYVHTTREIKRTVTSADVENEMRIEQAMLISTENSGVVANRLQAYYACRKYINCDAVLTQEAAGDVINIWDPVAKLLRQACIESIGPMIFSRTIKGRVAALVGFSPWQTVNYTAVHLVIDKAYIQQHGNTYSFPADIEPGTVVTVIAIEGGQAGSRGYDGEDGTANPISGRYTPPASLSTPAGKGGLGGAGGLKGRGGKIWIGTIIVNPLDSFQVVVGAGGTIDGAYGDDSKFGVCTSANGAPGGYYDAQTQKTYGKSGVDGVSGGNGGDGGSAGNDGKAGGDAGSYTGGRGGIGYSEEHYYTHDTNRTGGAGGGGAAKGENGGAGFDPPQLVYGDPQPGGDGGDGAAAAAALDYGDGGSGGNGGGGGGGGGAWSLNYQTGPSENYKFNSVGGKGGKGSAGTPGKDGCIILMFRKAIT